MGEVYGKSMSELTAPSSRFLVGCNLSGRSAGWRRFLWGKQSAIAPRPDDVGPRGMMGGGVAKGVVGVEELDEL